MATFKNIKDSNNPKQLGKIDLEKNHLYYQKKIVQNLMN